MGKFECGICGKEWDTPRKRAQCEIKCDEMEQKRAKIMHVKKLRDEEDDRLSKINKLLADLSDAVKKYEQDYGKNIRFEMGENNPLRSMLMFFDLLGI